jgi:hypothetical protein
VYHSSEWETYNFKWKTYWKASKRLQWLCPKLFVTCQVQVATRETVGCVQGLKAYSEILKRFEENHTNNVNNLQTVHDCWKTNSGNNCAILQWLPEVFCWKVKHLLGYEVLTAVIMKSSVFWNVMLCSLLLKMKATCSFEMSVDFQQTTQYYIPEDRTLLVKHLASLLFYSITATMFL